MDSYSSGLTSSNDTGNSVGAVYSSIDDNNVSEDLDALLSLDSELDLAIPPSPSAGVKEIDVVQVHSPVSYPVSSHLVLSPTLSARITMTPSPTGNDEATTLSLDSAFSPTTLLNALLETSTPIPIREQLSDQSESKSNSQVENSDTAQQILSAPQPPLTARGVDITSLELLRKNASSGPVSRDLDVDSAVGGGNTLARETVTSDEVAVTLHGTGGLISTTDEVIAPRGAQSVESPFSRNDLPRSLLQYHVSEEPVEIALHSATQQPMVDSLEITNETLPSSPQLLQDVLFRVSMTVDPLCDNESSSPKRMDESELFLSPNKPNLESSFLESTSTPNVDLPSTPDHLVGVKWTSSAFSDTASSDDEGVLSFVTAMEVHDTGDDSTAVSKEESLNVTRDKCIDSSFASINPNLAVSFDATTLAADSVGTLIDNHDSMLRQGATDPTTPKRSGRFSGEIESETRDEFNKRSMLNSILPPNFGANELQSKINIEVNGDVLSNPDQLDSSLQMIDSHETADTIGGSVGETTVASDSPMLLIETIAVDDFGKTSASCDVDLIVSIQNCTESGTPATTNLISLQALDPTKTVCVAPFGAPNGENILQEDTTVLPSHAMDGSRGVGSGMRLPIVDCVFLDTKHGNLGLGDTDDQRQDEDRQSIDTLIANPKCKQLPAAVSPISLKTQPGLTERQDDCPPKGQLKALQVEFPSALDPDLKRSDVSLSSASSTISHGSFTKGRTSSGISSPINAEESRHRKVTSYDSLPPRFPDKGKETSDKSTAFVDSLSTVRADETLNFDDPDRVDTKWIKQSMPVAFNPRNSIFASKMDAYTGQELSPPGSPPEPYYSETEEDSHVLDEESCGMFSETGIHESMTWDMIRIGGTVAPLNESMNLMYTAVNEYGAAASSTPKQWINHSSRLFSTAALEQNVAPTEALFARSDHGCHAARPSGSVVSHATIDEPQFPIASKQRPLRDKSMSPDQRLHRSSPDLRKLNQPLLSDGSDVTESIREQMDEKSNGKSTSSVELRGDICEPVKHNASLLEEELLAFSSLRRINLPFFQVDDMGDSLRYVGSARWKQLLACWKHTEMTRAMINRFSALHISHDEEETMEEDDSLTRGSSYYPRTTSLGDLVLNGISLKRQRGHASQIGLSSISWFLLNTDSWTSETTTHPVQHNLPPGDSTCVDHLLIAAESNLAVLRSIVEEVAVFASHESGKLNSCCHFSVGVKGRREIERKAKVKYKGNVRLVKDVLRARATFTNESGLVCGLLYLFRISGFQIEGSASTEGKVTMVRIKNLFCNKSGLGGLSSSPLPTGYRHLLLNVRLNDGMLAEIQFNLLPLFRVLGHNGYELHRELLDLEDALGNEDLPPSFDVRELVEGSCLSSSIESSLNELFLEQAFASTASQSEELTGSSIDGRNVSTTDGKTDTEHSRPKPLGASEDNEIVHDVVSSLAFQIDSGVGDIRKLTNPSKAIHLPVNHCRKRSREISLETRRKLLDNICRADGKPTIYNVIVAILIHGSSAADDNPRDVATFYCLHALFSVIGKRFQSDSVTKINSDDSGNLHYAQQCLLQCLKISNQAISNGMTGWLEYGRSSAFDRLSAQPFDVFRQLAYNFGFLNQWDDAEAVCLALVVRCDQFLPNHHPTTLTSLLDLAIVASMNGKTSLSDRMISQAAERLSAYLSEIEHMHISHLSTCAPPAMKPRDTVFRIDYGRNSCSKLHAYVSLLRYYLGRDIVSLVGDANEVILTNHCFIADALVVLSNCFTASTSLLGSDSAIAGDNACGWQLALTHYTIAFDGFSKKNGLNDPSTMKSAYGLARCLREFGEPEKAIQLLSRVVACTLESKHAPTSSFCPERPSEPQGEYDDLTPRFLPHSICTQVTRDSFGASRHVSTALCLWLMAILSVDQSRNETGRERAFCYLHAASDSLQSAMKAVAHFDDQTTESMCIRLLSMIEEEALRIAEPTYE